MKILVVCGEFPFPLDQGGRIRMYHLIRGLCECGHEVYLIAVDIYGKSIEYINEITKYCRLIRVLPHKQSNVNVLWRLVSSIMYKKPYVVYKHTPHQLTQVVKEMANAVRPDVILVEYHYIYDAVLDVEIPKIVDMHNIDSVLYRRFYVSGKSFFRKIHSFVQERFMSEYEKKVLKSADVCLVVSEHDANLLKTLSRNSNVYVVPNGVDVDHFCPSCDNYEEVKWDLIYVGSMDYYPNIDAVFFLVKKIMPQVWSVRPNTNLVIVGRNPSNEIKALEHDSRITVTGRVEDTRYYWNRSSIAVMPLRIGGGTRLKALEAASMGKAIVGTSLAFEGIPFRDKHHVCIADQVEQFAQIILDLLSNKNKSKELGNNAREFVISNFSWKCSIQKLENIIKKNFLY